MCCFPTGSVYLSFYVFTPPPPPPFCVQFVVGEDGSWGLLYEHATAEGPPIATLLDHVLQYWYLQT